MQHLLHPLVEEAKHVLIPDSDPVALRGEDRVSVIICAAEPRIEFRLPLRGVSLLAKNIPQRRDWTKVVIAFRLNDEHRCFFFSDSGDEPVAELVDAP